MLPKYHIIPSTISSLVRGKHDRYMGCVCELERRKRLGIIVVIDGEMELKERKKDPRDRRDER